MEITSKLMPRWMEIKTDIPKRPDLFKSIEYNNPVKQRSKKMMAFVDKDLNLNKIKTLDYNPARSIFNLNDFRNNVSTSYEAKIYWEKVSQKPRRFFEWDDGKKFNPKYKSVTKYYKSIRTNASQTVIGETKKFLPLLKQIIKW